MYKKTFKIDGEMFELTAKYKTANSNFFDGFRNGRFRTDIIDEKTIKLKKIKPTYAIGDKIIFHDFGEDFEFTIIGCNIGKEATLVDESGLLYGDLVPVKDVYNITQEEMNRITGGGLEDWEKQTKEGK